jgi:hypothetical protein
MCAIAHVINNGDDAGYLLAESEPYFSLAYARIVHTVMEEYCDGELTDTLGIAIWHPHRTIALNGLKLLPAGSEVAVRIEAIVPKGTDQTTINSTLPLMISTIAEEGTLHIEIKEAS